MKTIKFLRKYTVKASNGPTYEAGSVHNLDDASAMHFIRRGAAALVVEGQSVEPVEVDEQKNKPTEPAEVGKRGGDPEKRFTTAQRKYRKKALSGDDDE